MATKVEEIVDHCSWWFEGNWAQCCAQHDLAPQVIQEHWNLAECVSQSAGWGMGILMFVGLVVGGPIYAFVQRRKARKEIKDNEQHNK